jgi:hypothetical protein
VATSTPDSTTTNYDSLEAAEAAVEAAANQNGYAVDRLRSKTSKTHIIRKVWLMDENKRIPDLILLRRFDFGNKYSQNELSLVCHISA